MSWIDHYLGAPGTRNQIEAMRATVFSDITFSAREHAALVQACEGSGGYRALAEEMSRIAKSKSRQERAKRLRKAKQRRGARWTPIGRPRRVWGPHGKRMKSTLSMAEREAVDRLRRSR